MTNKPKLSEASLSVSQSEQIVMEILWQQAPLTSGEIVARLDNQGWNEKTVKSFLNRLVNKGVLDFEREGRRYWYRPRVKKADYLRGQSQGFLQQVFGGDIKSLLATFVDNKQLSAQELDYLSRLLETEERDND